MLYSRRRARAILASGTALCVGLAGATQALAQTASEAAPTAQTSTGTPTPPQDAAEPQGGLAEIVVTAQKREQRLQDVPIAITAITQERLEANRIINVTDISGIAPGLTARQTTGGIGIASFSQRGVVSYGVAPGSDKEVSVYLDGVYLANARGSIFDLPDIARIEVLRGPQGTLFGRNATAGAISIVTRDPTGEFHVKQDVTVGNYDQFRTRTSVDLPSVGPFSAYVTYVHDERRGDIRNAGAGTVWTYTSPNSGLGTYTSPKYLGSKNAENVFAALKFDNGGNFTTVYKFDYSTNNFTPEGQAEIAYNRGGAAFLVAQSLGAAAPFYGAYIDAIVNGNNNLFAADAKRPKVVNNSFSIPGKQKNYGHSVTSQLRVADNLSFKNVFAYRHSSVFTAQNFDGLGGLTVPQSALLPFAYLAAAQSVPGFTNFPAATQAFIAGLTAQDPRVAAAAGIGKRYLLFGGVNDTRSSQYSDELQANYESSLLTLTVGGIWFHSTDVTGGPRDIQSTFTFAALPVSGEIPIGRATGAPNGQGIFNNRLTSLAGYAQAELHVTDTIDIVGGGRFTHDKKTGRNDFGGIFTPAASGDRTQGTFGGLTSIPFSYKKSKFTYSIGANYKPNTDVLVYAKYSTGFVSGGTVRDFAFEPETVKSVEGGIKADWFDRRLRTNLALWHAKYDHLQSAQGGPAVGRPDLSVVVADIGGLKAKGFELEVTAAPTQGLTVGGSLSYTDAKFSNPPAYLLASSGGAYEVTLIPKWTSNMFAEFVTPTGLGNAQLYLRTDANWRSKQRTDANPNVETVIPAFAAGEFSPASWIVNARVALREIAVGPGTLEVGLWGRNLNNNRATTFVSRLPFLTLAATFERARTYGLDVKLAF